MHTLILFLSLVGCGLTGSNAGTTTAQPAAIVQVPLVEATSITTPMAITATGTVVGEHQSKVAVGSTGRVLETYAERGSEVRKGDTLLKLDDRLLSSSLAEAKASFAQAKASLEQANDECKRAEALFTKGLSNDAALSKSRTSCATAKATADGAEARLRSAEVRVSDTRLKAPFSGVVSERMVSAGEYVNDATVAFNLVEMNPLRLKITIGERDASRLHGGEIVTFTVAGDTQPREAIIDRVAPSFSESGRDLTIEAKVSDASLTGLKPGAFASASITVADVESLGIPTSALRTDGTLSRIYVLNDGFLEERIVAIGPTVGEQVAILDGLKAGEKVAAPLNDTVRDGARLGN